MVIGKLRIATLEALPFAREKLRAALVLAGLTRVMTGQIVGMLSQSMREKLPLEITVDLDLATGDVLLLPATLAGRYHRLPVPRPLSEDACNKMRAVLARLSREELLYDLERQVEERTSELNAEREKSERLLQNMLPASIARRLKNGETIADRHNASVVFVDIVGFTKWAAQLNASHLVENLDLIFGEFDRISSRHGLEKIKTIGDCYMAAAGLPQDQADHADRAVRAGLDIIANMARVREKLQADLQVRIGVHCGPLVAGVIGEIKPFYDIWGDTVNIAARIQQGSEPGRINLSKNFRDLLGDRIEAEARGKQPIKHHGEIEMFFFQKLK